MKKFLIRILIFAAVFFVVDKAFLFIRDASPALEVDTRLEKIMKGEIQSDLVILGSSRGARSVIAKQLEDSLKMTAFNLSYPGSDITFHEYILEALLSVKGNKKPKCVLLVVDDSDELKTAKSLNFRLERLYPLVKYKNIRDKLVDRKDKKFLLNELLVLHQMNKSNFLMKQRKFTKNDSIMPCGSMPISHQKKTFDKLYGSGNYIYSKSGELKYKLKAFKSLVSVCKDNHIKLIVAIPPNFRKVTKGFKQRLFEVANGYAEVWEHDPNKVEYRDPDYFFDNSHLQKVGSQVYTAELAVKFKTKMN